ncbi:MAG: hypothetical protein ACKO3A_08805 [Opitutia bacterium]
MVWAWFIVLLATLPGLWVADLLTDSLAGTNLILFISGAAIVAPCRRLKRWQAVLFAACVGFLFEARRPIPLGTLPFLLAGLSIFLTSNRILLRNTPLVLRGAILCNTLACTAWFTAAGLRAGAFARGELGDFTLQLLLQVGFAALLALLVFIPLALIQDAAMDRTGLPPALESP